MEQRAARLHPVDPASPVPDLGLAQATVRGEGVAGEAGSQQLLER